MVLSHYYRCPWANRSTAKRCSTLLKSVLHSVWFPIIRHLLFLPCPYECLLMLRRSYFMHSACYSCSNCLQGIRNRVIKPNALRDVILSLMYSTKHPTGSHMPMTRLAPQLTDYGCDGIQSNQSIQTGPFITETVPQSPLLLFIPTYPTIFVPAIFQVKTLIYDASASCEQDWALAPLLGDHYREVFQRSQQNHYPLFGFTDKTPPQQQQHRHKMTLGIFPSHKMSHLFWHTCLRV